MARKVALRETPSAHLNFILGLDYLGSFFIFLLAHQKAHVDFCVVCSCCSADEGLCYVRLCGREAVYVRACGASRIPGPSNGAGLRCDRGGDAARASTVKANPAIRAVKNKSHSPGWLVPSLTVIYISYASFYTDDCLLTLLCIRYG